MNTQAEQHEHPELAFLHEIGERIAASDPLHLVLRRVVEFISDVVLCDSCFVYVVEEWRSDSESFEESARRSDRAAQAAHGTRHYGLGGRTPKTGGHRAQCLSGPALSVCSRELPEDRYEAFLIGAGALPRQGGGRHQRAAPPAAQLQQARNAADRHNRIPGGHGNRAGAHRSRAGSNFADLSEARKLVEQAVLILQRDLDAATKTKPEREIAKHSRRSGKSMKEIASAVLLYDELRRESPSAIVHRLNRRFAFIWFTPRVK